MSVCIEQNHHNNFSQSLSTCDVASGFSLERVLKTLELWKNRSRQRKQLARLDDRLLKDIGLTRSQIQIEISKPFWK